MLTNNVKKRKSSKELVERLQKSNRKPNESNEKVTLDVIS